MLPARASCALPVERVQASQQRACNQECFLTVCQDGPPVKGVVSDLLDRAQNFQSPAREQLYIRALSSADKRAQLQPAVKERPGPAYEVLHERNPCAVEDPSTELILRISVRPHQLEGNVDASATIVARYVLPEIRQLQGCAGF